MAKTERKAKKTERSSELEREIASNVLQIVELERAQRKKRNAGERLSEVIAGFCGSMTFVYVHVVWFGFWIIFNRFSASAFDPFPYTFLTLVVSLEAIFLSTFILISQNHDTQLSERRNHLDLQINLLAEQENTKTLELLKSIAAKVGVPPDSDVDALLEPVDPKSLVNEIVKATDEEKKEAVLLAKAKAKAKA